MTSRNHRSNHPNNEEEEEVNSFTFTSPSSVSGITDPSTPRTANSSRSGRNNGRGSQVPLHPRALGIARRRHPSPINDNGSVSTTDTMEEGGNDEILQQLEVMEEEDALYEDHQRMAPGGDSDSEDEEDTDGFRAADFDVYLDRQMHLDETVTAEEDDEYIPSGNFSESALFGCPPNWNLPDAPDDWEYKKDPLCNDEPDFGDVDNPGKWHPYSFFAVYKETGRGASKRKEYQHHHTPTKCQVVPEDPTTGKRMIKDYEFHYTDWTAPEDEPKRRSGATRENRNPPSRAGRLNAKILKKLGLTKERMKQEDGACDALFFWQLLLPIHERSGIEGDPRVPYYPQVGTFTSVYAGELGLGLGYGHDFKPVSITEHVRFDGSIQRDGVRGGSNGAFLRRFNKRPDNSAFDKEISEAFTQSRWVEIKRVLKLNDNRKAKKRGEDGYDPAYKFRFIYDVMIKNLNEITEKACDDLTLDESSYPFMGWGEAMSGLIGYVKGKPGITRGGQFVIVMDSDRLRPRAILHRHKCHNFPWKAAGPSEVRLIWEQLKPMLGMPPIAEEGDDDTTDSESEVQTDAAVPTPAGRQPMAESLMSNTNRPPPKIFREKPHVTCDNYFSGEQLVEYAAEEEFGLTMTMRRDRLPKDIPSKYMHKEKTTNRDKRARVARFNHPVLITKKIGNSRVTYATFQSTSSTNICSVNGINEFSLYGRTRERGRGNKKRSWAIEMNESRDTYLDNYGQVDRTDHMMKNTRMGYRSHKYWHAPVNHGKRFTTAVVYDMYLECAEGNLDPEWKVDKPDDFHRFREKLSVQQLRYNPTNRHYPGDELFRVNTRKTDTQRKRDRSRSPSVNSITSVDSRQTGVTGELLDRLTDGGRLCGYLGKFRKHVQSVRAIPNGGHRVCCVCGVDVYQECGICGAALHYSKEPLKKDDSGNKVPVLPKDVSKCFYIWHDRGCVGIPRNDYKTRFNSKEEWSMVGNVSHLIAHYESIKRLDERHHNGGRGTGGRSVGGSSASGSSQNSSNSGNNRAIDNNNSTRANTRRQRRRRVDLPTHSTGTS